MCRLDHCLSFLAEIFIHIEQDVLQLSLPPPLVSLQGLAITTYWTRRPLDANWHVDIDDHCPSTTSLS